MPAAIVRNALVSARTKRATVPLRKRVARQGAETKAVKAIAAKVREQAVLDMLMPNGERLGSAADRRLPNGAPA